jgi:hypothetical protein
MRVRHSDILVFLLLAISGLLFVAGCAEEVATFEFCE